MGFVDHVAGRKGFRDQGSQVGPNGDKPLQGAGAKTRHGDPGGAASGTSTPWAGTRRAAGRRNLGVGRRGLPWASCPWVRESEKRGGGCRAQFSVGQLRSGIPYQKVPEMKEDPGGGG